MRFWKFLLLVGANGLTFFAIVPACYAQETVFNVPSGDTLDRGKVYGELDVTYRPSDGRFCAIDFEFAAILPGFEKKSDGAAE